MASKFGTFWHQIGSGAPKIGCFWQQDGGENPSFASRLPFLGGY
jgi:hypothetical protein